MRILSEPKNSLIKQYKRLFELDGVDLEFEENALKSIAKQAIERNTGARGLRSIIEENMTQIMFDIPSDKDIEKVLITPECITDGCDPVIIKKVPAICKAEDPKIIE